MTELRRSRKKLRECWFSKKIFYEKKLWKTYDHNFAKTYDEQAGYEKVKKNLERSYKDLRKFWKSGPSFIHAVERFVLVRRELIQVTNE